MLAAGRARRTSMRLRQRHLLGASTLIHHILRKVDRYVETHKCATRNARNAGVVEWWGSKHCRRGWFYRHNSADLSSLEARYAFETCLLQKWAEHPQQSTTLLVRGEGTRRKVLLPCVPTDEHRHQSQPLEAEHPVVSFRSPKCRSKSCTDWHLHNGADVCQGNDCIVGSWTQSSPRATVEVQRNNDSGEAHYAVKAAGFSTLVLTFPSSLGPGSIQAISML
jgi:hypothetical protein